MTQTDYKQIKIKKKNKTEQALEQGMFCSQREQITYMHTNINNIELEMVTQLRIHFKVTKVRISYKDKVTKLRTQG